MKKFKALLSIIIVVTIAFLSILNTFALTNINNEFAISVDCEEEYAYSSLRFNIYKMIETSNTDFGIQYEHIYDKTVSVDNDGVYKFSSNSSCVYIEVVKDSIQQGYCVNKPSKVLNENNTVANFLISKENLTLMNSLSNEINLSTNNNTNMVSDCPECGSCSQQVNNYDIQLANLNRAASTNPNYVPNYINDGEYTNGFFTIHYESDLYSDSIINAIYYQLSFSKASLCSTYMFETPILKEGDSTYHVYLNPNLGYAGVTPRYYNDSNNASYIVLDIPTTSTTLSTTYKSIITHEFMHAVQYEYYDTYDPILYVYNEATARLAQLIIEPANYIADSVNLFLETPEYFLFDNSNNRGSGGVLFPLYIKENYGGFTTIKNIYESYHECLNLFTAMDSVLSSYGASFDDAYLEFREACYDIRNNYNQYQSNWSNSPAKTILTEDYVLYTMPKLSARYFEAVASESGDYYTFTFSTANNTSTSILDLKSIQTNSNGVSQTQPLTFTGGYKMVTYFLNPGSKVCLMLNNTSTSMTAYVDANLII
ncbi:MAG: hypothetical protein E7563_06615 [Ruminococcaceae bacterium]|nr:hypothetical protein [Oscillospiraceae bacterium]